MMSIWDDGFDDDYGAERLLDSGWWPSEKAAEVIDAIKALRSEPIYEGGDKANGISAKFLMRLTLLESAAELRAFNDPMTVEALEAFAKSTAV